MEIALDDTFLEDVIYSVWNVIFAESNPVRLLLNVADDDRKISWLVEEIDENTIRVH